MGNHTEGRSKRFSLFFFLSIALFIILALLTKGNNDIWHHLKTGELIFSTRLIPHEDIYSFTATGKRWIYHSWLSASIFYITYEYLSTTWLIALRVVIIAATVCICFATCRLHKISDVVTAFLLFLLAFSNWQMFIIRPHLFSYLFLSMYLYIFETYRLGRKSLLMLIPLLQVLWSNVHAGSLLGIAILFLYTIGLHFEKRALDRQLIYTVFLSVIASFINPNGFRLYTYAIELYRSKFISSFIYEWRPPFSSSFMGHRFLYFFSVWLLISILAFLMKLKTKSWLDASLMLLFLYVSVKSFRHIALAMICLLPAIGKEIRGLTNYCREKWDVSILGISGRLVFSLGLVYVIVYIGLNGLSPAKDWKICKISMKMGEDMPNEAVEHLLENNLPGEVFNSYDLGSYLIYRFFPDRRVYIDGRIAMYGEKLAKELLVLSDEQMDRIIKKYGIKTALISRDEPERLHRYFINRNFNPVYSDKYASIYTRE